ILGKYGPKEIVGVEVQEEITEMANRSVILNQVEDKIKFINRNLKDVEFLKQLGRFDALTVNPPYKINNSGIINPSDGLAIARHEILCDLEDVLRESSRILKTHGRFYMVHRPFRLAEILGKMSEYRLEPKRMRLVYPYIDKEPNMVLIEGLKDGRARMTVEKPLIVYREPGVYMPEIYDIYGY
ncbi:MAG: SAM-dependent methyltransferase, partial [Lachnospiraceae bacterium]|nr:SAM-dependent methyltransferase [Lachnospiraceae bacterium]